ncbi:hypothetical protein XA68_16643 [Ophiocordyceps unilateralis]|uniref:Uncharacterized protein n=1 Tax=Ophiocordyceps unilateralis TaxID=268505 RepID=A0A2A9PPQ2_OPHUN|nr:hypothetical protein XA68_16643 [Ophiocordyceps unilateralis]
MAVMASRGSTATSNKPIRRRSRPEAVENKAALRIEESLGLFARDGVTISIILAQPEAEPTNIGQEEDNGTKKGPDVITIPLPTARQPTQKASRTTVPASLPTKPLSSTSSRSRTSATVTSARPSAATTSFAARQSDLQSPTPSPAAEADGGAQASVIQAQGTRVAAIGIAAGVFAGVALIVLTAALIYRCRKRKKSSS